MKKTQEECRSEARRNPKVKHRRKKIENGKKNLFGFTDGNSNTDLLQEETKNSL